MYTEDDFIMLSALQHFAFCPRQCALIHQDHEWTDSYLTKKGDLFHQRVDSYRTEKRKDIVTEFSLPIHSFELGLSGKTDIVEFYYSGNKIIKIIPIEYKLGKIKKDSIDEVQLCAQALCLEEMTAITIPLGYFYYGRERRRTEILLSPELRKETKKISAEIHALLQSEILPQPKKGPHCRACSLREVCRPDLFGRKTSVGNYIDRFIDSQSAGDV